MSLLYGNNQLAQVLPTYHLVNNGYNPNTIPPRLYDNSNCGVAEIYKWCNDPALVQKWIHGAFDRRRKVIPDNSLPSFTNNRSGERWQ